MAFLFPKYFPFCVEETDEATGDGTEYPFAMSLEDAMALYWKNKTLIVEDSTVYSWTEVREGGDNSDCVATHSGSSPSDFIFSYWPDKMSEMICPPSPYYNALHGGGIFGVTITSLGGTYFPEEVIVSLTHSTDIKRKGEDFFPFFTVRTFTELEYNTGRTSVAAEANFSGVISKKVVRLIINGNTYETSLFVGGEPDVPRTSTSLSGFVTITEGDARAAE